MVLPSVILPLIQIPILSRRDELLRPSQMITEIRFPSAGKCHDSAVVEVIVPNGVEPVAVFCNGTNQAGILRFIFSHKDCLPVASGRTNFGCDLSDDVRAMGAAITDGLSSIKT